MDTIQEKAAYLRGLVDGMKLDSEKDEVKAINAIVDTVCAIASKVGEHSESIAVIDEYIEDIGNCIDAIDADLADVEQVVSDYMDDIDYDDDIDYSKEIIGGSFDDDEDIYEVECPQCGSVFNFTDDEIERSDISCPECGFVIDDIVIEDEEQE